MPTTPDRTEDSDDPFAVAEAAEVAHETVPVDIQRDTEAIQRDTEAVQRSTEAVDVAREQRTVLVDDKVQANRETVKLPTQRRPPQRPAKRAPLPVAAAFATLWAALLSYLPVAAVIGLARTLEGSGGLLGAAHAGLAGWLLGHGVPIGTSIGSLGLTPLLLSMLVVWRLSRAGLHVTRAVGARRSGSTLRAVSVAFAIALTYSLLGSVCALLVDGRGTEITAGRAALNFFVIGGGAALVGSLRGTDALRVWAERLPGPVRHGMRTGVMAALFVLAAGAGVTGLSIAIGGGQAADMISAYRTGVAGQAGITLVSLAYGVNGVIWAAAYLLGPGFALGTGSVIRLTEVTVGPLPTLPLLAGLPNGPMGAAGTLLLALPVAAGLAVGWLLMLRLPRETSWPAVLGSGLLAGPVAGVVLGLLAEFSGGPLGDGRLATIGPDPWTVGLVATAVLGVSAALGAAAAKILRPAPKA
ncbi:cell division protein PerM [Paractinoplanes ovalisporus]|uniref:cell division protein PerM n=1 Tax=Paractinoplanes ovalisporus TaxID=2810368 RepID=UPI001F377FE1|nr:DUF6350 family protein [Actinoplanes ovalisporus]